MKKHTILTLVILSIPLNFEVVQSAEMKGSKAFLKIEGDQKASMEVSIFRDEGELWKLESSIKKFGITFRKETASFKFSDSKFIPLSWERKGQAKVDFNWSLGELIFKEKKEKGILKIRKETLGPATAQLQIRIDLMNTDISSLPESLEYFVYYKGKIKRRIYNIEGLEIISVPYGEYQTVKISRQRSEDDNRTQIFWFAPKLDYSIVQIHNDDGKQKVLIKLKKLESIN